MTRIASTVLLAVMGVFLGLVVSRYIPAYSTASDQVIGLSATFVCLVPIAWFVRRSRRDCLIISMVWAVGASWALIDSDLAQYRDDYYPTLLIFVNSLAIISLAIGNLFAKLHPNRQVGLWEFLLCSSILACIFGLAGSVFLKSVLLESEGTIVVKGDDGLVAVTFRNPQNVTDTSVREIVAFKHIKAINLRETQVSDHGISYLVKLKQLSWLSLANTEISDDGLKTLGKISSLRFLSLVGTKASSSGIEELRGKLPMCDIRF